MPLSLRCLLIIENRGYEIFILNAPLSLYLYRFQREAGIAGHLVAIQVVAESFISMLIASSGIPINGYMDLVLWGTWIFAGVVLIALPAITAILVVNLSFGVMTRASPQLNIFAVGFPVIMTVGFAL